MARSKRKKRLSKSESYDGPEVQQPPVVDDDQSTPAPNSTSAAEQLQQWIGRWRQAWDGFWFSPRAPQMLGWIRLLTGLIVLWTLLAWTFELSTFFAIDGLLPLDYRTQLGAKFAWSHLDWFASSPSGLLAVHCLAMIVVGLFASGCWTRVTSVFTALLVISYGNRSIGAGFGLDQINVFLCLYCAIGNSGGSVSLDRWWRERSRDGQTQSALAKNVSTNIAIRLIQIHLCVVYFFAAIGKLQGDTWWTGEAVWLSLASYEYQTIDMTWLANYLPLVGIMTLTSLFWELFYPVLVWPRLTRPLMLAIAVPVHLGIGLCMGMMSFGLIMLVANLSFIEWNDASAIDNQ
ncbi:MAG: HTTM domain-containing protein [Planctomycetota bacterium]